MSLVSMYKSRPSGSPRSNGTNPGRSHQRLADTSRAFTATARHAAVRLNRPPSRALGNQCRTNSSTADTPIGRETSHQNYWNRNRNRNRNRSAPAQSRRCRRTIDTAHRLPRRPSPLRQYPRSPTVAAVSRRRVLTGVPPQPLVPVRGHPKIEPDLVVRCGIENRRAAKLNQANRNPRNPSPTTTEAFPDLTLGISTTPRRGGRRRRVVTKSVTEGFAPSDAPPPGEQRISKNAPEAPFDQPMLAVCLHGDTPARKQAPDQPLREPRNLGVGPPSNHPTPHISAGHRRASLRKQAVPRSTLRRRKRSDQGKCKIVSKGGLERTPRPSRRAAASGAKRQKRASELGVR